MSGIGEYVFLADVVILGSQRSGGQVRKSRVVGRSALYV